MSEENFQITTEGTPNPNALKFVTNRTLMESGTVHYTSQDEEAKKSPLAVKLFSLPEVTEILVSGNFITVNKTPEAEWPSLEPVVKSTIEAVCLAGEPVVPKQETSVKKSENLTGNEAIEAKIQELLDKEIRPAVAQDGGDIIFYGYKDGVVTLHLQGACSSCPSAIMTLKVGVENYLKQAIPEIVSVEQV